MSTNESTPRVGRWTSSGLWECDCGLTHWHAANVVKATCGCTRPPLPATPAPRVSTDGFGKCRWCGSMTDSAGCLNVTCAGIVAAVRAEQALPKPSPRFLTDAQVVGKEVIAGVDDAGKDRIEELFDRIGEGINADDRQTRHENDEAFAALKELKRIALRAVPVEGGEPVAWALWHHRIGYLHTGCVYRADNDLGAWAKGQAEALAAEKNAALGHDSYCVIPLYAHPAPDGEVRDA